MRQMILSYMRRGQHQQLLRILFTLLLLTGRPPCIGPDLLSVSSQVGRKRKSIRRRSYLANNFNRIELGEIVQVALLCTQYVPAHRPEMSEVGQMLQWFRCSSDLDAAVHNCKFQSSCHHFSQWKVYIYIHLPRSSPLIPSRTSADHKEFSYLFYRPFLWSVSVVRTTIQPGFIAHDLKKCWKDMIFAVCLNDHEATCCG